MSAIAGTSADLTARTPTVVLSPTPCRYLLLSMAFYSSIYLHDFGVRLAHFMTAVCLCFHNHECWTLFWVRGLCSWIIQVPELASLGRVFRSAAPVELTESETEYVVRCVKHMMDRHVVLDFSISNTIEEQVCACVYQTLTVGLHFVGCMCMCVYSNA